MPLIKNNLHILEAAFRQDLNSVVITDADWTSDGPHIVLCNDAFCRMTGYTLPELLGKNPRILQGPQSDRALLDKLRTTVMAGRFFHGQTVNYRKDGTPYHVKWNISPVYDSHGKICNFISIQQDVSAQIRAEQERDMLVQALNVSPDPIIITDAAETIVFANKGFERLTGYTSAEVCGRSIAILQFCEEEESLRPIMNLDRPDASSRLISCRRKDGQTLYTLQSKTRVSTAADSAPHTVCIAKDVTQLIMQQRRLYSQANRDRLTGLLNRHAGESALSERLQAAHAPGQPYAVILCDIDHFKRINDSHGHPIGDRVLVKVAQLLQGSLREGDLCFRWGGEEFLILLPDTRIENARQLANRLREAIAAATLPEVGQVTISFGVGQASAEESTQHLLARVDKALYRAKSEGRNRVVSADAGAC